jgi:hypothetical protein
MTLSKIGLKPHYLTLLSISTLISGCSIIPSVDTYDPNVFSSGSKGVAILRVSEHASYLSNETDMSLTYNIKRIGDDQAARKNALNSFIPGSFNYHDYTNDVMMLDPGIYYIDFLQLDQKHRNQDGVIPAYQGPGITKLQGDSTDKYRVEIGAFEVKPGKVTYFGHASLSESANLPFTIKNELDKVKAELKKGALNELSDKIEPGQFIQTGNVIIDKSGNNTGINSQACP